MKTISVRVVPRSSKNEVVGEMADGKLKVRLSAAPVNGKANDSLLALLSDYFKIPKYSIAIVRGKTNKTKLVKIG